MPASGSTQPGTDSRTVTSSEVVVTPAMTAGGKESIGRGATLSQRCTVCHGVCGMSGADTPNLAGQYPEAIYKQLKASKPGHRKSTLMAHHVRDLSDQEMMDLAAYYAYLPRLKAPSIVQIGASMRNIAPCISCHGGSA